MAELTAAEGKTPGQILKELEKSGGSFYTDRINIHVDPAAREGLLSRLAGGLKTVGSYPVEKFITTDGWKFMLPQGQWVAFRASGTEPVFRCYIEARSKANLARLRQACGHLLKP
jgi:phosphomannomutase